MVNQLIICVSITFRRVTPIGFIGNFINGQQGIRLQGLDTDFQFATIRIVTILNLISVSSTLRRPLEADSINYR